MKSTCLRFFLLSVTSLLSTFTCFAGIPDIVNFSTKDYRSHSINYSIVQDHQGIIYVGNAEGVLEYDGQTWRKIKLDNDKSALALDIDSSGRIWVGSSSEFGYIRRNAKGENRYISLKHQLPKEEISEILEVLCHDGKVYFRGLQKFYCWADSTTHVYTSKNKAEHTYYLGLRKDKVEGYGIGTGLFQFEGKQRAFNSKFSKEYVLREILEVGDYVLYLENKKVFSSNTGVTFDNIFPEDVQITAGLAINNNEFLVATLNHGLFHLDADGLLLGKYTKKTGLQDNNIHALFKDKQGNIWLAYNNGLGLIKWDSPVRYIPPSMGIEGMGYCAKVQGDTLYVGTSTGLYYLPQWKNGLSTQSNFVKVKGIDGVINYLALDHNKLLACQGAEVYQINGSSAKRISIGAWNGAWMWKPSVHKNTAYVGTYLGMERYVFNGDNWRFDEHIKGFKESSRVFEEDQRGIIWTIQGNKGLFRVEIKGDSAVDVKNYAVLMKKAYDHFNEIFKFNNKIYIATKDGVYFLEGDELIKDPQFDSLGEKKHRIRKHNDSSLYAIHNDKAHVLIPTEDGWRVKHSEVSFLKSYLVGFAEFFGEVAPDTYFIGTQDGFAYFESKKVKEQNRLACLIREVRMTDKEKDSLIQAHQDHPLLKLPYGDYSLKIKYSIPFFGEKNDIRYQTQLLQNDKAMHGWQNNGDIDFKEFTNLKEGNYQFHVRALKGQKIIGEQRYDFEVKAPWYRSGIAYGMYALLLLLVIFFIRRLFINQAKKLEEENQKEIEIKEKLHKAEKLELELKNKENELAYMALTYTQKKDLLANLINQLNKISRELDHADQIKFRSVKKAIADNLDDEKNWENFQVHFDEKNDNFFQKLKAKEKRMNESHLLFCSYVRMGKSNKEIAELLNLSVAAVEKRKYRLKKKWNLPDDTSFTEFLRNL